MKVLLAKEYERTSNLRSVIVSLLEVYKIGSYESKEQREEYEYYRNLLNETNQKLRKIKIDLIK